MQKFYTNCSVFGNNILVRGIENGIPFARKEPFSPSLFINTTKRESKYTLLNGQPVERVDCGSLKEAKDFIKTYADVSDFEIHGQTDFVSQYISEKYTDIKHDSSKIRIHFIDIETETEFGFPNLSSCNEKVSLITIYDTVDDQVYTFGCFDYQQKPEQIYIKCKDEEELLKKYVTHHAANYPHIMSGWYSNGFDIPYLTRRIEKICGEHIQKKLSPWAYISQWEKMFNGSMEYKSSISGIACIDYMELYKKFTFTPQENYQLDTIAEYELEENKIDHSQYGTFKEFYTNNPQLFTEYNIQDTMLIYKLEKKLKLLELVITVAYLAKINYEDVFSPVKTWDCIIYNHLKKQDKVIPQQHYTSRQSYVGGHVKEPQLGRHKYVASFDLQSLYPHLIMQYAISMETILNDRKEVNIDDLVNKTTDLDFLHEKNVTMAANGCLFERKEGVLPVLMQEYFDLRSTAKKEMIELQKQKEVTHITDLDNKIASLDVYQQAVKILLNSAYGGMGSPFFRYYDIRIAEAITTSGQLAIRWMERKINEFLNKALKTTDVDYIIASDTDSLYLNLETLVTRYCKNKNVNEIIEFLDDFCKKAMAPFINKSFIELSEYMNAYKQKMFMKRECLADVMIITAKKKYCMNVYDKEGVRYDKPKLKIVGLQMIQSTTPKKVKVQLKGALDIIINGTEEELQKYILTEERKFNEFSVMDIARPQGIKEINKFKDSRTIYKLDVTVPIYVRAAILHNHLINTLGLKNVYEQLTENEKIKYVYLKMPNPIKENVIGFGKAFPKEFKLERYVDYDLQWEKVFMKPIVSLLDTINWKPTLKSSLGDLF